VEARIVGILLFLPVPVVLVLFTRMPFGVVPSIAAGLALMLTHPHYARPWAVRHAAHRCLWCGGPVAAGTRIAVGNALAVSDPRSTVQWGACSEEHRTSLVTMLRFAAKHGAWLRVGILGTVAVALVAAVLADRGWLGPVYVSDASAFFRLGVGLTVLPLGWLGPRLGDARGAIPTTSSDTLSAPFPLHLAALIGINAVLWLFRLVGLIWLAQGAFHFVERAV
jgi:hypothetical protein